jgi:hypothetical protein
VSILDAGPGFPARSGDLMEAASALAWEAGAPRQQPFSIRDPKARCNLAPVGERSLA